MIRYNNKTWKRTRDFCAISIHQGVRLRVKQILNTSRTYLMALLLPDVYHVHPQITSRADMGMHSLLGSIEISAGKGFFGWS